MDHSRCCNRNVHGILLLDKPKNMSSNFVLQKVKRIYNVKRAGYAGTLDPLATGMLPIFFGEATKFSQYLLNADKCYRVVAKLGQRTTTSDADGLIIQERPVLFNIEQLNTVLNDFRGNILQVPSMYSALKYRGKRLYKYARQGIEIPRKPRMITIHKLVFIRYENSELELEIYCSKGTYIRTIIDELGEKLNCGAHIVYLRRLNVGNYFMEDMITIEQLQLLSKQAKEKKMPISKLLDPLLMPIDSSVRNYPVVNLPLISSTYFKNGHKLRMLDFSIRGLVRVTEGKENKFIGVGKIDNTGYIIPLRLIIERVI